MPALTSLTLVPSRLSLLAHLAIVAVVSSCLLLFSHVPVAIVASLVLVPLAIHESRRVLPPLYLDPSRQQWFDQAGHAVVLTALRTGPSLMCLRYARRIYWVWPDSAPAESLWVLRRSLMH